MADGFFSLACPTCFTPLEPDGNHRLRCSRDRQTYSRIDGIWRLLAPERAPVYQRFIEEYDAVRRAEERGSADPAYYRALPFRDLSGRREWDWRIRAVSFGSFLRGVLEPLESAGGRKLKVVDLGAGNAWLSHRLAQRGHSLAAVDLRLGREDGLGAHVHYDTAFLPIQAEFDRLPFVAGQIQLAVFNASLHYSTDYEVTLAECLRVLEPQGTIVILDTPVYREGASGRAMVREREAEFEVAYGFPSNALASENFLTWDRIRGLGSAVGLEWRVVRPWYGLSWALRPWAAKLRGGREPAQFVVLVGRRPWPRAEPVPSAR